MTIEQVRTATKEAFNPKIEEEMVFNLIYTSIQIQANLGFNSLYCEDLFDKFPVSATLRDKVAKRLEEKGFYVLRRELISW